MSEAPSTSAAAARPPRATAGVLVWEWPLRLWHWLFAGCISGSLYTGLSEDISLLTWHMRFGYCVLGLLMFRLLWAIWVGWIFSTVGAFGGIMAGVGHITIFGLADYAKSFGKGSPMNKLVTDSIRVSNQWLVGMSGLISSTNYYRMGRLVAPLGLCLAIGGVGGSWLTPKSLVEAACRAVE